MTQHSTILLTITPPSTELFFPSLNVSKEEVSHIFVEAKPPPLLLIFSLDLVYLFSLQTFIFYRLLPLSLGICLMSMSLRNFSNTVYCFLASILGGKIYTCFFHSCYATEAALARNK